MGQTANMILTGVGVSKRYAESMLKDVTPEKFARLGAPGGATVESNHAAFVYGHLSLYFPRVLSMLGQPAFSHPPMFEELFTAGKPCVDDAKGTHYPSMEAILAHFNAGMEAATDAITRASDADLGKPNPAEGRMKEMFPTIGDAINFLMNSHVMWHLGQVSGWRRMMGLGSAM